MTAVERQKGRLNFESLVWQFPAGALQTGCQRKGHKVNWQGGTQRSELRCIAFGLQIPAQIASTHQSVARGVG